MKRLLTIAAFLSISTAFARAAADDVVRLFYPMIGCVSIHEVGTPA